MLENWGVGSTRKRAQKTWIFFFRKASLGRSHKESVSIPRNLKDLWENRVWKLSKWKITNGFKPAITHTDHADGIACTTHPVQCGVCVYGMVHVASDYKHMSKCVCSHALPDHALPYSRCLTFPNPPWLVPRFTTPSMDLILTATMLFRRGRCRTGHYTRLIVSECLFYLYRRFDGPLFRLYNRGALFYWTTLGVPGASTGPLLVAWHTKCWPQVHGIHTYKSSLGTRLYSFKAR